MSTVFEVKIDLVCAACTVFVAFGATAAYAQSTTCDSTSTWTEWLTSEVCVPLYQSAEKSLVRVEDGFRGRKQVLSGSRIQVSRPSGKAAEGNGISLLLEADAGFSRWEIVSAQHIRRLPKGRRIDSTMYTEYWYRALTPEDGGWLFELPISIDVERRVEWPEGKKNLWQVAGTRLNSRSVHLRIPLVSDVVLVELYRRPGPGQKSELLATFEVGGSTDGRH